MQTFFFLSIGTWKCAKYLKVSDWVLKHVEEKGSVDEKGKAHRQGRAATPRSQRRERCPLQMPRTAPSSLAISHFK